MRKLTLCLLLVLVACAKHPRYDSEPLIPVGLDDSIEGDHKDLIEGDLRTAAWAKITDTEGAEVLGLKDFSRESLSGWLGERLKVIVGESFDLRNNLYGRENFTYKPLVSEEGNVYTTMMNLGTALYVTGKEKNILLGVAAAGRAVIIDSPRAGLMQIGEGLFSQKTLGSVGDADNLASSFRRIQTYFHEGRHSDGNGKDVGFQHIDCTSGDYVGKPACDRYTNGPYTIGRIILERLFPLCDECTEAEKAGLEILIADLNTRVSDKELGDPRPEKVTP